MAARCGVGTFHLVIPFVEWILDGDAVEAPDVAVAGVDGGDAVLAHQRDETPVEDVVAAVGDVAGRECVERWYSRRR